MVDDDKYAIPQPRDRGRARAVVIGGVGVIWSPNGAERWDAGQAVGADRVKLRHVAADIFSKKFHAVVTKGKGDSEMATDQPSARWETIHAPLIKLHVDLSNPRHDPFLGEAQAIAWLYNHEKVEALARDIVDKRGLSPLDRIGLIAMEDNAGHFIAVEGNRRLCALLLLNDPDRAPTPVAKTLFAKLSQSFKPDEEIEATLFASRADAKHWIALRHLGPQDGQGTVSWTATQKDRAAGGGPNALAVAVLDRARDRRWLPDVKPPAVTTLSRYLHNLAVREALGLGDPHRLVYTHAQDEVDRALRQFLLDALPPRGGGMALVNSRSKLPERTSYVRTLRTRGVSPTTVLSTPITPDTTPPTTAGTATGPRNRQNPSMRKYLVPSGFVCNTRDINLQCLFHEMKRTEINQHEFANAYLLRAFVERIMALYLRKVEPGYQWKNDQALVQRCAEKIDPAKHNNKYKSLRVAASNTDASHSLHTLGAAVHSSVRMDRAALVSAWANWESALTQMINILSAD